MWYAKRLNDGKEFLACRLFVNEVSGIGGIFGVSTDGEKVSLEDGEFEFYKK